MKDKKIYILENQRYIPFLGFSIKNLLSYERDFLSDQDGNSFPKSLQKKLVKLYKNKEFEPQKSDETDNDGYVYSFRWNLEFTTKSQKTSLVRKRMLFFPQISCEHENIAGKSDIQDFIPIMKNPHKAIKISENLFNPDCIQPPTIISETYNHLAKHGTNVEGIFRVSGETNKMKEILDMYDRGEKVILDDIDIHTVSGLFKGYIRNLRDPLLTYSLSDTIVELIQKPNDSRIICISQLIQLLPPGNQAVLKCLLSLCKKVIQNQSETKMDVQNLGIIFAHSILRKKEETPMDMIDNMKKNQTIFEFLVDNFEKLYEEQSEETKEKLQRDKSWMRTLKKSIKMIKVEIHESTNEDSERVFILDTGKLTKKKRSQTIISSDLFDRPIEKN